MDCSVNTTVLHLIKSNIVVTMLKNQKNQKKTTSKNRCLTLKTRFSPPVVTRRTHLTGVYVGGVCEKLSFLFILL